MFATPTPKERQRIQKQFFDYVAEGNLSLLSDFVTKYGTDVNNGGFNVNALGVPTGWDHQPCTPLMVAVFQNRFDIIEFLLSECKALPELPPGVFHMKMPEKSSHQKVFLNLVADGKDKIVDIYLKVFGVKTYGGSLDLFLKVTPHGWNIPCTPLGVAVVTNNTKLAVSLAAYNPVRTSLEYEEILIFIVYNGRISMLKALVDAFGADVKKGGFNLNFVFDFNISEDRISKYTLLLTAALKGHGEIVKYLLECGASIGLPEGAHTHIGISPSPEHQQVFLDAAFEGYEEIVKIFIDVFGVIRDGGRLDVNATGVPTVYHPLLKKHPEGKKGGKYTPLLAAAEKGHRKIMEMLFDHGALVDLPKDINIGIRNTNWYVHYYYNTSLLMALAASELHNFAEGGLYPRDFIFNLDGFEFLLRHGADLSVMRRKFSSINVFDSVFGNLGGATIMPHNFLPHPESRRLATHSFFFECLLRYPDFEPTFISVLKLYNEKDKYGYAIIPTSVPTAAEFKTYLEKWNVPNFTFEQRQNIGNALKLIEKFAPEPRFIIEVENMLEIIQARKVDDLEIKEFPLQKDLSNLKEIPHYLRMLNEQRQEIAKLRQEIQQLQQQQQPKPQSESTTPSLKP